jgi:hypothetical protein
VSPVTVTDRLAVSPSLTVCEGVMLIDTPGVVAESKLRVVPRKIWLVGLVRKP